MTVFLVLPILIPAFTAALSLLAWRSTPTQHTLVIAGSGFHLLATASLLVWVMNSGIQILQVGNWPAPFGISLVVDLFSAIMLLFTALLGLVVALYALANIDTDRQQLGFVPLYQVLLMGVSGAFLTGDLFNLYVWFEVMLIASFVMMALGGEKAQLEGALKYVTLNLLSSAIFLAAVGLLYATARTLNMADLALKMPLLTAQNASFVQAVAILFLIGFGIKAAVFPFFFWLPASYPTPPAAVSAIFAGLLTKVGVYALFRVFVMIFPHTRLTFTLILILASLSMLIGVLGAVSQYEFRRILSFHSVSQIGYIVLGLGLLISDNATVRKLAIAASIFYVLHHMLVKTNLFLIAGIVRTLRGTTQLIPLGGLATSTPWLAALFMVSALSLAGIPPLTGFWAKLSILRAGLMAQQYVLVTVAIVAGLCTLISMIKIWNEAFWKPAPEATAYPARPAMPASSMMMVVLPVTLLVLLTLGLGLYPQPLLGLVEQAAEQMLEPVTPPHPKVLLEGMGR